MFIERILKLKVNVMVVFVLILLLSCLVEPKYKLIYTDTGSVAKGFYLQTPYHGQKLEKETHISFHLDPAVYDFLKGRDWMAGDLELIKPIQGLPGDDILFDDNKIYINGEFYGERIKNDRLGLPLPWLENGHITLADYQVFAGSRKIARSFDSRYFGPVPRDRIIGVCYPLFTFE